MIRIPPRENLDYDIASVATECACPKCGQIHLQLVNLKYNDDHSAWRTGGYLVVTCKRCKGNSKCPRCGGTLIKDDNGTSCMLCSRHYEINRIDQKYDRIL